jgi:hypothetical protein
MEKTLSISEFLTFTVPLMVNKNATVVFKPDIMGSI